MLLRLVIRRESNGRANPTDSHTDTGRRVIARNPAEVWPRWRRKQEENNKRNSHAGRTAAKADLHARARGRESLVLRRHGLLPPECQCQLRAASAVSRVTNTGPGPGVFSGRWSCGISRFSEVRGVGNFREEKVEEILKGVAWRTKRLQGRQRLWAFFDVNRKLRNLSQLVEGEIDSGSWRSCSTASKCQWSVSVFVNNRAQNG